MFNAEQICNNNSLKYTGCLLKVHKYEVQPHMEAQTMAKAQKWGWFLS